MNLKEEIKNTEQEKRIRLNHPCVICNKTIFISEGTIIENKPQHFKCYKQLAISEVIKKIKSIIAEQIKTMDSFYDNVSYIGNIDFIKELPPKGEMIEARISALMLLEKELDKIKSEVEGK